MMVLNFKKQNIGFQLGKDDPSKEIIQTRIIKNPRREETIIVAVDGSGDTDSISDAMAMLPSNGGSIFIKEGVHKLNGTITITKGNITIRGVGKASEIKAMTDTVMFQATSINGIQFEDVYLNANSQASAIGISLSSCTKGMITGVWFLTPTIGIDLQSATNFRVENNFIDSDAEAISLSPSCNRNIISGNILLGGGTAGIFIDSNSDQNVITGNVIQDYSGAGQTGITIFAATCDKNLIVANAFFNNTTNISDAGTGTINANNSV